MSPLRSVTSWSEVGERVAEARQASGYTQAELASRLGLNRTAITKIESGHRQLDALELLSLAHILGRSPEWFVSTPPPAVTSWRAQRSEATSLADVDALVEELARDVELLIELGELDPPALPERPTGPMHIAEASGAARRTRERLGVPDGPLPELLRACETFGLYGYSMTLNHAGFDGAYLALERGGVTLVNGSVDPGRRRFNLAHELGHHVLADEYATDFALGEPQSDTEKVVNAFAINLLMPDVSIVSEWRASDDFEQSRDTLIRIAARYRVSWSAACYRLLDLGLIDQGQWQELNGRPPTRADYIETGVYFVEELAPPALSSGFAKAVLRAFRKHKLGPDRAVEMLRGTVVLSELPPPDKIPIAAFTSELAD